MMGFDFLVQNGLYVLERAESFDRIQVLVMIFFVVPRAGRCAVLGRVAFFDWFY